MKTKKQKDARTEPCAVCSQGIARERVLRLDLQLLNRIRSYARREWHCDACDESYTDDAQAAQNDAALVQARADALREISGEDLRLVRELVGVTQSDFEALCGLGKKTVARWETGRRALPGYIVAMIRLLALNPMTLRELAEIQRLEEQKDAEVQALKKSAEGLSANELRSLEQLATRSPSIKALATAVERYKSIAATSPSSVAEDGMDEPPAHAAVG